ncbi:MAG: sigma-70 family RNA polymerase sigma factor [Eubacteriales bacterium]
MESNLALEQRTTGELFELYKVKKDKLIKQEIVLRYCDMVRTIAVQLRNVYISFAELDDVVNEGIIALMQSVDRFDPAKNVKFETYASLRIRGTIVDLARKQDWVPRSVRKVSKEIDTAIAEFYYENARFPSDEEVAKKLGMPLAKYQKALGETGLFNILSLDALVDGTKEDAPNEALLKDENELCMPDAALEEREMQKMLADAVGELKENEQMVISLYYRDELSMKEVAKVLNVSEARVSQIHSAAIKKMRLKLTEYMKG